MSTSESGLLYAFVLDGKGGGTKLDWAGVEAWKPADGVLWVHLDYGIKDAATWIDEKSKIDRLMIEAVLDHDPRPRAVVHGDDLLLIIRGINLNAGAEPEDMISVRSWIENDRVITMRHRVSRALKGLAEEIGRGRGPKSAPDFVVQLCDRVIDNIVVRVDNLSDQIAALEDRVLTETREGDLRARIADHRRRAIALRRFLGPQRDALAKLQTIAPPWLGSSQREQIAEETDRMARVLEELDAARDRAGVTQEELASRLAEMSNKRLYVLSMITAVFLPLGFVCALLGVNVGGVPYKEAEWAFWALCAIFAVGVGLQLWWFKKRGWL